jgi:hypothetical protein
MQGAEGCRIVGCHISDFYEGISVTNNTVKTNITDCEIDGAIGIGVASQGTTYGVYVSNCSIGMIENYTPPGGPTSGVYIDTEGQPSTNIEGIMLVNCIVFGYENAGLHVNSGQAITVIGGKYSSNGVNPESSAYGAGIAITGGTNIRIIGADCSGNFQFWNTTPQPYGVAVSGGASYVLVSSCDLTANGTGPLYVSSPGTPLEVIGCMGYNDLGTVLQNTTSGIPSTIKNTSSWPNATGGWFGPIAFYVTGAGHVTIDSNDTGLSSGGFTLSPGESASLQHPGDATNFLAVGK